MTTEQYDALYDAIKQQAEQHYLTHWLGKIRIADCARCDSWYSILTALQDYEEQEPQEE